VEAGWAASHTKNTYLRSKYERLVARKGNKRALIAIGHKILCAAFHILKNHQPYIELGAQYLDLRKRNNQIALHLRKLKALGLEVEIKSKVDSY
jgi:hypothetical protein